MPKRSSRDVNEMAASVIRAMTETPPVKAKNPAAVALGRLGGLKGGKARAEVLSAARKKSIAKRAALARWGRREK
jgi:hypothetical protein